MRKTLIIADPSFASDQVDQGRHAGLQIDAVFFNHDDDPAALARDAAVEAALRARGIAVHHSKDTVLFERDEVLTAGGTPYSVFTPYKNAWLKRLTPFDLQAYPVDVYTKRLAAQSTGSSSAWGRRCPSSPSRTSRSCSSCWRGAASTTSCTTASL